LHSEFLHMSIYKVAINIMLMNYEIKDPALAKELDMRGIGFQKDGRYYIDVLQAAYLTDIGKVRFDDALAEIGRNDVLASRYVVFRDLRKNMHVANYVEKDDVFLVYDKGMVPKRAESQYTVKLVDEKINLGEMISLRDEIRKIRKALVLAIIKKDGRIEYYKFQEIDM